MTAVDTVFNQTQELTIEQQVELFHRLEESLHDAGWQLATEPSDYVKNMLDERIREADANPDDFVPWETVRDEALARCRK